MKFIHAADIHLDSSSTKIKKLYGQKEISVIEATHQAFVFLIDYAVEQEVDFMVLSGDLFDSNWRDYSIGLFFIEQIQRLDCPIYYIRGNHDSENRLFKSLPFPKNFMIFKSDQPQTIINEDLKIAIHGQSYSHYHTKEDLAAGYPIAAPGYFNIGLLHTSGEKQNGELPYAPYDKKKLLSKKYDYWALGHIHSAKIISKEPHILYSGILQGRHAKETGPKGCYLAAIENNEITSLEFKQLGHVRWEVLSIDLSKVKTEEELKSVLLEKVEPLLVNLPKEVKFIIRFLFEGNSQVEKPIFLDVDYYRNAIHCWLSNRFDHELYIEKLVDNAHYRKGASQANQENALLNFIYENLEDDKIKSEIDQLVEDEKNLILSKLPQEVLEEIQDEEMKDKNKDNLTLIKHYLQLKLMEGFHEDRSS